MTPPRKLTVGSTFGIYPPLGGGQLRVFHLYRRLANYCPVDVVALVAAGEPARERQLARGLTEIRVPKTGRHAAAEAELEQQVGVAVTDVAFAELHAMTPAFAQAIARSAAAGGVLVASHPYALPAFGSLKEELPLWYDVHNVEADLKEALLGSSETGRRLLSLTRAIERDCCRRSELVLASSDEDALRLRALYEVPRHKLVPVPNGVDSQAIEFVDPARRRQLQEHLLVQKPLALFIGSWHPPNVRAAEQVVKLARRLPEVTFAIVGSVCIPLQNVRRPPNVELLGILADAHKQALLALAVVALNPMLEGSGTNMKMLDYLAAGVPVVSTAVGARGLRMQAEAGVRVVPVRRFRAAVRAALNEPHELRERRAREGRRQVEQHFDWGVIADGLMAAAPTRTTTSSVAPASIAG